MRANVPTAVFTTPKVGTVGLSQREARAIYDIVDIYEASFRPLKATLSGRGEKVRMKIVVDGAETEVVVGVHVLGEDAGEMAQLLAIAIRLGAKKPISTTPSPCIRPRPRNSSPCACAPRAIERMTVGPEAPDAMPMGEGA